MSTSAIAIYIPGQEEPQGGGRSILNGSAAPVPLFVVTPDPRSTTRSRGVTRWSSGCEAGGLATLARAFRIANREGYLLGTDRPRQACDNARASAPSPTDESGFHRTGSDRPWARRPRRWGRLPCGPNVRSLGAMTCYDPRLTIRQQAADAQRGHGPDLPEPDEPAAMDETPQAESGDRELVGGGSR